MELKLDNFLTTGPLKKNAGIYANTFKGIWGAGTGASSIVFEEVFPMIKTF